jgi:hypothetical protein
LRASAPALRDIYMTEWYVLNTPQAARNKKLLAVVDVELFMGCERLASRATSNELAEKLAGGDWALVAAAAMVQRASFTLVPVSALEVALSLVQTQAATRPKLPVWLVTAGAQLGQSVSGTVHAGSWGLARVARTEAMLPALCIDSQEAAALEHVAMLTDEFEVVLNDRTMKAPRLARVPSIIEVNSLSAGRDLHLVTGGTGGLGLLTARWLALIGRVRWHWLHAVER